SVPLSGLNLSPGTRKGDGGTTPARISSSAAATKPCMTAVTSSAWSGMLPVIFIGTSGLQDAAADDRHEAENRVGGGQRDGQVEAELIQRARIGGGHQEVGVEGVLVERFERNARRCGDDRLLADQQLVHQRRRRARRVPAGPHTALAPTSP